MKLKKANLQWLVFTLSAIVFFWGAAVRVLKASNDFVPVYTGARCLLHGCNPYDTAQLEQQFYQAGGHAGELPSWDIDVPVYPPSTFLALSPLGALPFPAARLLWFLLNGCLFVTAAAAMTWLTAGLWRWLGTIMVSIVLATSSILLILGQPAAFAISLLVIATSLFLRGRFLPLAAVLLALSLAVKPQIGALIGAYLLLRGIHAKYAAAASAGAIALLVCGALVLQQHPGSAAWLTTLEHNLSATLAPGGSADPRPENQQSVGDINLQALTSIYLVNSVAFDRVAQGIFLLLLTVWVVAVLRSQATWNTHLLALSALAVLSLMPVYHRFYDARLLLLTIPAVVLICERRRVLGGLIAALTLLTVISVQYRVQAYLLAHAQFARLLHNKVLFLLLLRQQNIGLLLLFGLYVVAIHGADELTHNMRETAAAYEPAAVTL